MTDAELRSLLKRVRMSSEDLARVLGVAPATVRNWTSGRQRVPPKHYPALNAIAVQHGAAPPPVGRSIARRPRERAPVRDPATVPPRPPSRAVARIEQHEAAEVVGERMAGVAEMINNAVARWRGAPPPVPAYSDGDGTMEVIVPPPPCARPAAPPGRPPAAPVKRLQPGGLTLADILPRYHRPGSLKCMAIIGQNPLGIDICCGSAAVQHRPDEPALCAGHRAAMMRVRALPRR